MRSEVRFILQNVYFLGYRAKYYGKPPEKGYLGSDCVDRPGSGNKALVRKWPLRPELSGSRDSQVKS